MLYHLVGLLFLGQLIASTLVDIIEYAYVLLPVVSVYLFLWYLTTSKDTNFDIRVNTRVQLFSTLLLVSIFVNIVMTTNIVESLGAMFEDSDTREFMIYLVLLSLSSSAFIAFSYLAYKKYIRDRKIGLLAVGALVGSIIFVSLMNLFLT
jgi:hypothetical protein